MQRADFWEQRLLSKAVSRSKEKGWECNLTIQDIVIPEYCPYLGVELTRARSNQNSSKLSYNPSIDRIDSSKGYVKGNVQIISTKANRMKNDATPQELIVFAMNVMRMYSKKPQ